MTWLHELFHVLAGTVRDITPILLLILFFQFLILRRPLHQPLRVLAGLLLVIAGLTLFLVGLDKALFPLGRVMARQLTSPDFLGGQQWQDYYWVYIFAFLVGGTTTMAEPSLIAVAIKANQVSGGTINVLGLRLAVALGVAIGISLGTWRIVTGYPVYLFITTGYVVVILQTLRAPKMIVPLAYDSGGVTTSTVTVPLVAALGLGLAETIPGRNPMTDGFGLIAFASLFPMITVMAYAQIAAFRNRHTEFRNKAGTATASKE